MLIKIEFALLLIVLILMPYGSSFAEPIIRVPVDCHDAISCGYDLDVDSAKESENKLLKSINSCKEKPPRYLGMPIKDACEVVGMVYTSVCDKDNPEYYYWADPRVVENGNELIEGLKSGLSAGAVVDDKQIVISSGGKKDEDHIAVCDVRKIKGVVGPPRDCRTVAIVTPNKSWIRAQLKGNGIMVCLAWASFRMSGSIDVEFNVLTGKNIEEYVIKISDMMNKTLGLNVEIKMDKQPDGRIYSASIYSTSSLRNSVILVGGWREALDFDVHLTRRSDGVEIRGVARALVSRQAVGSMTSYQGLDDGQKSAYATKLDNSIKEAIKLVCSSFREMDSKNIICS